MKAYAIRGLLLVVPTLLILSMIVFLLRIIVRKSVLRG